MVDEPAHNQRTWLVALGALILSAGTVVVSVLVSQSALQANFEFRISALESYNARLATLIANASVTNTAREQKVNGLDRELAVVQEQLRINNLETTRAITDIRAFMEKLDNRYNDILGRLPRMSLDRGIPTPALPDLPPATPPTPT